MMTVRISALAVVNVLTGIFVLHHMHTAVGELSIVEPVARTFLKNALIIFQALLLFLRTDSIRPRIARNEPNASLCSHFFNWILYFGVIVTFIAWCTISYTLIGELFFSLWIRLFVWDADYFMFNFSKSIIFGWALVAWTVSTIVLALPEEAPQLPVRFVHLPAAAA